LNEIDAFLLGLIQGLTEFLPVSSSGHLVLTQELLGVRQEGLRFEVAVHVATLVSVLAVYRRRAAALASGSLRLQADSLRYVGKLALATVPAAVAYLVAGDWLEVQFEFPPAVGVCLIVTGAVLWTTRWTLGAARLPEPSWTAAALIGCAQAFAILPGISRSGSTVALALALGVAPAAAAEFSFLMSVIAIAGAALVKLPDLSAASPDHVTAIAIGGAVALVSGVAAIRLFVRLLKSRHFYRFAYYTWAAGALFLVWLGVRG
jgi:undecaprenyl-diphosphatase